MRRDQPRHRLRSDKLRGAAGSRLYVKRGYLHPDSWNPRHARLRRMPTRDRRRLESLPFDNLCYGQNLHSWVLNTEYFHSASITHETVELRCLTVPRGCMTIRPAIRAVS